MAKKCVACGGRGFVRAGENCCLTCSGIGYVGHVPTGPTNNDPGTPERIAVYAARFREGLPIHHPNDVENRCYH